MVAILPKDPALGVSQPIHVGTGGHVQFEKSGTICLRINESPANLGDNDGQLTVEIKPSKMR